MSYSDFPFPYKLLIINRWFMRSSLSPASFYRIESRLLSMKLAHVCLAWFFHEYFKNKHVFCPKPVKKTGMYSTGGCLDTNAKDTTGLAKKTSHWQTGKKIRQKVQDQVEYFKKNVFIAFAHFQNNLRGGIHWRHKNGTKNQTQLYQRQKPDDCRQAD